MTKTSAIAAPKTYKNFTIIYRLNGIDNGQVGRQMYFDGSEEGKLGMGEYEIHDGRTVRNLIVSHEGYRWEITSDQMYMIQDQGYRHMIGLA